MKKILLVSLFLALIVSNHIGAKPVDPIRAQRVGSTFLTSIGHSDAARLTRVEVPFKEFYVFQAGGAGFVLVSGDDCVRPILGYSLTGEFVADGMPDNVRGWLEDYESEIARLKQLEQTNKRDNSSIDLTVDVVSDEWNRLTSGAVLEPQLLSDVSPLLTTTWNQKPLYNKLCPYDSDHSENTVTGCVATATAQIMKYWNHPTTGYGNHSYTHSNYGSLSANFGSTTYNWANMPNSLTSSSSSAQVTAVATLMKHVGVAVEMDYDVSANGGSGAHNYSADGTASPSSQFALPEYFKYSPDVAVVTRSGSDDESFSSVLRDELDQNRPILYSGRSNTGGHSFVCDGYDAYNNYHFNWGWGGYCDGFYTIGALNPAPGGVGSNSTSTYNNANVVVIGIRPNANFGNGGTVTVSKTGGNTSCSVSGGGTYSNGATVTLKATAATGYRFAEWSDHSHFNSRIFVMNGGNYSLTARFESIGSSVMSYCGNRGKVTAFGSATTGADKYWGIKLPTEALTVGRQLSAVGFFAVEAGSYDVTVYKGTTSASTQVFTTTVTVSSTEVNNWKQVSLSQNYTVESGKSLWIIVHNTDVQYPAAVTTSSGNKDGFLWGANKSSSSSWNKYSAMVRGYFATTGIAASGDTISYCDQNPYVTSSGAAEWGIKIPATELEGRNYLKYVKLYAKTKGIYTLRVYQGGASAPGTLVHTQPVRIASTGWHEMALDQLVTLSTSNNLWITFSCSDVTAPATACSYADNTNSNWISNNGSDWTHLATDYSWMIKAVTSASAPTLPAPTVYIQGDNYAGMESSANFSAVHTTGTTVSWTFADGTPSTATGDAVSCSWSQSGQYSVVATASNSNGIGRDTLWVTVVDCDQPISEYPYNLGFESNENLVCVTTSDADADGNTWKPSSTISHSGNRSYASIVTSFSPDNWLFLPQMQTRSEGEYKLQWYQYTEGIGQVRYSVYVDTTGNEDMSHSEILNTFTLSGDNVWQPQTLDLSSYAGKTIQLAFRCHGVGTANLYIDDLSVTESMFFREGNIISYCGDRTRKSNIGNGSNTSWGIRFTPERLADYDTIKSVMLYVTKSGDYTLNIAQGGEQAPGTTQYSTTVNYNNQTGWQEIVLPQAFAVDTDQPLWITFNSTVTNPACAIIYSGDTNSDWICRDGTWAHVLVSGNHRSWMIKAVMASANCRAALTGDSVATACNQFTWYGTTYTASATPTHTLTASNGCDSIVTLHLTILSSGRVDTVSYCGDGAKKGNIGPASGKYYWGIRLTPTLLSGYDTLKSVMLYVTKDGDYTLNISQGGEQAPGTTRYSTTVNYTGQSGWQEIVLPQTLAVNAGQPLWITFSSDAAKPACAVIYSGDTNSDWKSTNGTTWSHVLISETQYTWMIKAVVASAGSSNVLAGDTVATACDRFTWYGTTYTESSTPTHTLTTASGCDSTVTLHLTVNHADHQAATHVVCESYTWTNGNGTTYNETGTYTHSHADANGCTQVDTLYLTVNHADHQSISRSTCESYIWNDGNGATYDASGTYTYRHTDANGCTQVDTLHLTINNPVHGSETVTACGTYSWHNTEYAASGNYTYRHADANGCTQVDTLHLTIGNPVHGSETVTACGTYSWHNTEYAASGNYTYRHTDANGCTQVDTLHLTIGNSVHGSETVTACGTYFWHNTAYAASGDYTYRHTDANGCTQVDTLHLTILSTTTMMDTVSYCGNSKKKANIGRTSGLTYYWGIRMTPEQLAGHETLKSVMLYVAKDGDYTLNIAQGGEQAPGTTRYSTTVNYTTLRGWQVIVLPQALAVDASQPLWITFSASMANPACATTYSGDANSDWKSTNGTTWSHVVVSGNQYSWMIKAVMESAGSGNGLVGDTVATVCDRYTWYGTTYTESATATHTLTAANGCDSTVTLHLTVNHTSFGDTTAVECESFDWYEHIGMTVTQEVTHTFVGANIHGCDSTVTLHLSFNQYTVLATSNHAAMGTVTGGGTYCYGATATLTALANGDYHFIQWSDGNTDNPRTVTVTADASYMALFEPNQSDVPKIAYVGVDGNGHNTVNWMPRSGSSPVRYNLYREGVQAGVYELAGTVSANGSDAYSWIDELSNPAMRAYSYRLSEVSADNTESELSAPHTTMHLQISQGQGDVWNLSWTPYAGFAYSTYRIYRGVATGSMTLLATLPATSTTFSDLSTGGTTYYYQIEVVQLGSAKSEGTSSRSNIVTNSLEPRIHLLTVLSADILRGTVSGSGNYAEGDTATLEATAKEGYIFLQWQDGSTANPREVLVTADGIYVAYFAPSDGIEDVEADNIVITSRNGHIVVTGAEKRRVMLTDALGRILYRGTATETLTLDAPATGVYLLQVEGRAARRISVVR